MNVLALGLFSFGAACLYFKDSAGEASNEQDEQSNIFLTMVKVAQRGLKILEKAVVSYRGEESFNLKKLIQSPTCVGSAIFLLGTSAMAYSKMTPFAKTQGLFSKGAVVGDVLWKESKNILCMYELMTGIVNLAVSRTPPIKEIGIATAMIVGERCAAWYFNNVS